jgi:hypothetical protein
MQRRMMWLLGVTEKDLQDGRLMFESSGDEEDDVQEEDEVEL